MRFSIPGGLIGAVLFIESLRPPLLPLGAVSQIIFGGIVIAVGYDIGLLLELVFQKTGVAGKNFLPRRLKHLAIFIIAAIAVFLTQNQFVLQQEQRTALKIETNTPDWLLILLGSIGAASLVLQIGRLIRTFARFAARRIPTAPALIHAIVWALIAGLGYALFSLSIFALQFSFDISSRPKGISLAPPSSLLRSGGPNSLVLWEQLGQKGQEFIARDAQSLPGSMPEKTVEPIRIYASMENEPDLEKRIDLIMQEFERMRAFERSAVVFFTPSGTGWVNPVAVEAVERLTRGNSASISLQYSNNQAIMQYLRDRTIPGKASALLFSKIRQRLDQMPKEQRPKVYIYGESLGSMGSQEIFADTSLEGITRSIDGALWVGSPASGPLWSSFGLPQIFKKTRTNGDHSGAVRVAAHAADLLNVPENWGPSRVAFLYNATDPVVWFTPRLLYQQPEWLNQPRPPELRKDTRWWPLLTFGHIWFELFSAKNMPSGVGHNYDKEIPCAVANVIQIGADEVCFEK